MITEAQIDACVKDLFANIEFTKEPAGLYDPLRYMIGIGGKRIRPRLCILAYSLFKDEIGSEILEPAAGLEVFHSFTLIHDDIMDNADVRRGVPTVCRKWDDNTAILSGDVMCIDSYKRMGKAPAAVLGKVMELFSNTAAQVCDGQQYDMDFENRESVPMGEYMNMVGLKTGVLIACSAKIGALIAGASDQQCDLLYKFGYDLGLAFQIADDWLDTFGDQKVFGKAIGGDILNDKKTWLLTRSFEKADADCKKRLLEAMGMPCDDEAGKAAKIAAVRAIYDELGVGDEAKAEIVRLHGVAIGHIHGLGVSKIRVEMLKHYADALVARSK